MAKDFNLEGKIRLKVDESDIRSAEEMFQRLVKNISSLLASLGVGFGASKIVEEMNRVGEYIDYNMRQVWTITNISKEQLDELQYKLLDIAKQGTASMDELTKAFYQAVSSGMDLATAYELVEQSARLSVTAQADLFQVVDVLTSVVNGYKLSLDAIPRLMDKFFKATELGKTTISELASALGNVIPIASQIGISIDEVLSAIVTLTLQGFSTSEAVTSIAMALSDVIKPSEQAIETAQKLGVEFNSTALQTKGLVQFLKEISEKAQGNTEELAKLFGSVQGLRGVLGLTGNAMEKFADATNQITEASGNVNQAWSKVADSTIILKKQIEALKDEALVKLYKAFKPLIEGVLNIAKYFLEWYNSASTTERVLVTLSATVSALIPLVLSLASAIKTLRASFGDIFSIISIVAGAISGLMSIFGIFRARAQETNKAIEDSSKAITQVDSAVNRYAQTYTQLTSQLEKTLQNAQNIQKEANNTVQSITKILNYTSLVNDAWKGGADNVKSISKYIDEIVRQNPSIAKAVQETTNGYAIQIDNLKSILDALRQRLEMEIKLLEAQRQQVELAKVQAVMRTQTATVLATELAYWKEIKDAAEQVKAQKGALSILRPAMAENESYTRLLFKNLQEVIKSNPKYSKAQYLLEKNAWVREYGALASYIITALERNEIDIKAIIQANEKTLSESAKNFENAQKKINEYVDTLKKQLKLATDPEIVAINNQINALKKTLDEVENKIKSLPKGKTVTIDLKTAKAQASTLDKFKSLSTKVKDFESRLKAIRGTSEREIEEKRILLEQLIEFYDDLYELTIIDPTTADVILKELKLTKDTVYNLREQYKKEKESLKQSLSKKQDLKSLSDYQAYVKSILNTYQALSADLKEGYLPTLISAINDAIGWIDSQLSQIAQGTIKGDIKALLTYRNELTNLMKQFDAKTTTKDLSFSDAQKIYDDALKRIREAKDKENIFAYFSEAINLYRSKIREALVDAMSKNNQKDIEYFSKLLNEIEQQYSDIVATIKPSEKLESVSEQLIKAKTTYQQLEKVFNDYVLSDNANKEGIAFYVNLATSQITEVINLLKQLLIDAINKGDFSKAKEYEKEIMNYQLLQKNYTEILKEAKDSTERFFSSVDKGFFDAIFTVLEQLEYLSSEFTKTDSLIKRDEIKEQILNNIALLQEAIKGKGDFIADFVKEQIEKITMQITETKTVTQQRYFESAETWFASFLNTTENLRNLIEELKNAKSREEWLQIKDQITNNFNLIYEYMSEALLILNDAQINELQNQIAELNNAFDTAFNETIKKFAVKIADIRETFEYEDTTYNATFVSFFNVLENIEELSSQLTKVKSVKEFEELQEKINNNLNLFIESLQAFDYLPEQVQELFSSYFLNLQAMTIKQLADFKLFLQDLQNVIQEINKLNAEGNILDFDSSNESIQSLLEKARTLKEQLNQVKNVPDELREGFNIAKENLEVLINKLESLNKQQEEFYTRLNLMLAEEVKRPESKALESVFKMYDEIDELSAESVKKKLQILDRITSIAQYVWSNEQEKLAYEEWANREKQRLNALTEHLKKIDEINEKITAIQNKFAISKGLIQPEVIDIKELQNVVQELQKPAQSIEEVNEKLEIAKMLLSSGLDLTLAHRVWLEKIIADLEKQKDLYEQHEQIQKKIAQIQVDFEASLIEMLGKQLEKYGALGKAIEIITEGLAKAVRQAGGLENAFKDINLVVQNIGQALQGFAIQSIGLIIQSIANMINDLTTNFEQNFMNERTKTSELLKNYREYAKIKEELDKKELAKLGVISGGGLIGAIVGALAGNPWLGALVGGGLGALISSQTIDKEIEELEKKLEATLQKVSEALGTSIDDVANALYNAFDTNVYEDFVKNFADSIEKMTKQALIKSFLASEVLQPLFKNLSEVISLAVVDGVLTNDELNAIRQAYSQITDNSQVKAFFDALNSLFASAEETTQSKGSASTTRFVEYLSEETYKILKNIEYYVKSIDNVLYNGILKVEVVKPITII